MNTLIPWRTPAMFEGLRELDHLLNRFMIPTYPENGGAVAAWKPSCDVEETDKEYLVKVDLPGVEPKDVEISWNDNVLILRGEKKTEKEVKKNNYHRVERYTGSFYRELPLPAGTDPEKITATSAHGVVTVSVPKKPTSVPKKIPIQE